MPSARDVSTVYAAIAALTPAERLLLGYSLTGARHDEEVAAYAIANALHRRGFAGGVARGALTLLLLGAADEAGFEVRGQFVKPRGAAVTTHARALRARITAAIEASFPVEDHEGDVIPVEAPPAKLPQARSAAPSRAPAAPARAAPSRAPAAPPPRAASPASRTSPASATPARSAPSAATPPPRAAAPPAPARPASTPTVVSPPVDFAPVDASRIAAIFAGPRSDAASVSLAIRAHALSSAADFQDLLGLSTLRGVDPHVYQTETVRRVLRVLRGRALLADEVGLGKTIEALMILREYQLRGMARRALVIAPPALIAHWVGELEGKAGLVARTTDDPRFRDDPEGFFRDDGVIVASLSLLRAARHAPAVQAAPWDIVVVDEAHHVKNRQTAGWKLVDGIKSRFLLLLTATPVETDLEEIYNLVTVLKPGQLTTPAEFRRQFVDAKDPTKPRDAERLRRLLGDVMVRNTRAQSGLALPPRYVSTVAVDPGDAEREVYDATVALLRAHATDAKARLVTSTLLLEAGSSPDALRGTLTRMAAGGKHGASLRDGAARLARLVERVDGSKKLDALLDIVRATEGKVLVFTRFRDTIDHVARGLRAAGADVALFHGGLRADEKQAALARFRAGTKVLLATDVGGEGQNLQFCQTLVNFDLPWNPMLIEQRIGRLHRMGQAGEVRVFNLCARGTAEDKVLDVLDRRLHLFELVVGEMDMVLGNLGDEKDLEERILELYATAEGDDDVARGFDRIASELASARGRYEKTRALDEALFRADFEA